ncbi:MAG TPA: outer membrane protein assembly factor BamA [Bacteroidia bacterium]|nr:outer membrane protein assembly factor BamA [Bacteroidia bacterium]
MKKIIYILILFFATQYAGAQIVIGGDSISYASPKEYVIAKTEIEGVTTLDANVLKLVSGLVEGARVKVPGEKFSDAVKNLWRQGFFDDIQINVSKIEGDAIYLKVVLQEKPRMGGLAFRGDIKKKEAEDFKSKMRLSIGKILTDQLLSNVHNTVKEFYMNNGYTNAVVTVKTEDSKKLRGKKDLYIIVDKGSKVRIKKVEIFGNEVISGNKLRRKLKDTKSYKWWLFRGGKYLEENFEKDKPKMLEKYLTLGYRDARIAKDTTYFVSKNRVKIDITVEEGHKYFFRNINWIGNSKYRSGQLDTILGIKKGEVFNQTILDQKLYMNPSGYDISSLYMDDGYLFFQLTPAEVNVENDSIDLEIRMFEGKQAIINRVTVVGNTKTNDHVIMREIRTLPGQLFRRSDVQRTMRQLQQLGYFNPETIVPSPKPNPADGTVDIEYAVEEKPNDQISLSGGWGGGRIIGTLGVTFNNFSAKNFFKKESWSPLPSGDGQRLSVSAQSNGVYYQGYNISFTEPYLGGKKPQSLTVGAYYNVQNFNGQPRHITFDGVRSVNPRGSFMTSATATMGFGKRLKWPDDYFQIYMEQTYSYYTLYHASVFLFQTGYANNIKTTFNISRNSLQGNPIFPTGGSNISLTSVLTPPWSLINGKDYTTLTSAQKYKFLEYQKYKFTTHWYMQLTNKKAPEGKEAHNLVLRASYGFGILGMYNPAVGVAPFERFYLGGSGLTGYSLDGREIIALRGYSDNSISGKDGRGNCIISKYTLELRYPLSLNPQATIFALAFAEAGNAEQQYKDFNPFSVKRSAGVGVRIFLPMFGLLGLDYGWGFDTVPYNPTTGNGKGQFHFTIGASLGEL